MSPSLALHLTPNHGQDELKLDAKYLIVDVEYISCLRHIRRSNSIVLVSR